MVDNYVDRLATLRKRLATKTLEFALVADALDATVIQLRFGFPDVGPKYSTNSWSCFNITITKLRTARQSICQPMVGRLQNKVCVITGTGGSMGRAAALLFAREGAKVIGCGINVERDTETVELVLAEGGVMDIVTPCNLTKTPDCERLVQFAVTKYGHIDVLYDNGARAYFAWMDDINDDIWYKTIDEELNLVFLLTRAAWPHLKKSGRASIVNIGSVAGMQVTSASPSVAHSAAKGAVIALNRQFALEGRHHGIRANTIPPGLVITHQTQPLLKDPEGVKEAVGKIMLNRGEHPEEIAATALFFASDESSFISGTNIPVDGGAPAW